MNLGKLITNLRKQKAHFFGIPIPLPTFILGVVLIFIAGKVFRIANADKWRTFEYPEYRFSIDYPANWTASKQGSAGFRGIKHVRAIIHDGRFLTGKNHSLWVYIVPLEDATLDLLAQWDRENFSSSDKAISKGNLQQLQIGSKNYLADKQEFEYLSESWELTHYYLLTDENTGIIVEFWSKEPSSESAAIFTHMLDSFTLTENNVYNERINGEQTNQAINSSPFWGLAMGLATLLVSEASRPKKQAGMLPDVFCAKHPKKKWVYLLLFNLPFLWVMAWISMMLAIFTSGLPDTLKAFLGTFPIFAGIVLLDGLLEAITLVSIKRTINFARGFRKNTRITYETENRQRGLNKISSVLAIVVIFFLVQLLTGL
ncbi:MAG: hypothetical protein R3C62_16110 [Chloroflexota bacterium]